MSTDSSPPHMWRYWRDKYGAADALRLQFPNTLAASPQLQMALFQIAAAEALINQIMGELPQADDE